jgi:hypothetical protein
MTLEAFGIRRLRFFITMKLSRVACQFIDSIDGRPIPLVVATATDNTTVVSDNAGYIAISVSLPKGTPYFLHVHSPGYDVPSDGFGYRGIGLRVGGAVERIRLRRTNIAQRSGRVTGTGKYIHAQFLGLMRDLPEPPLTGMDSVQTAAISGKRYVFYGDTNWTGYPLGNFKTTNGIAKLQSHLQNCPYVIDYSMDAVGSAKPSMPHSDRTPGVTWISGIINIGNAIVGYANHRKSLQEQLSHGFVRWDPAKKAFVDFIELPETSWQHLDGHPITFRDKQTDFVMFGHAIPNFRVPADINAIKSSKSYETFTCLLANGDVETDPSDKPIWRWRLDGSPIDAERESAFVKTGKLKRQHCRHLLYEYATKRTVIPHRGSVRWNDYLRRWILIFTAINDATSVLGELFIAAGASPIGPWTDCIRVATHPKYSFYNPVHHTWLDQIDGRLITIEGTYTMMFSGNNVPTPQYEYNQLTYQVDLGDDRLTLLRSRLSQY